MISSGMPQCNFSYMYLYTGEISLTIPWTNLYTEPLDMAVHDVYLIAGPIRGEVSTMIFTLST